MAKSRRIKTNAEEAVKEDFNMETEDPIQQDPVQEEMVEGIKEIEQEQPEQKALVMSIDAITLSAMRTLQAKQKAKFACCAVNVRLSYRNILQRISSSL